MYRSRPEPSGFHFLSDCNGIAELLRGALEASSGSTNDPSCSEQVSMDSNRDGHLSCSEQVSMDSNRDAHFGVSSSLGRA